MKHETIDPMLGDFAPALSSDFGESVSSAPATPAEEVSETTDTEAVEATEMVDGSEASDREPLTLVEQQQLEEKIIEVLRTIYDPEIPVDIYELGLIYEIKVDANAHVVIQMTLTSPACPVAGTLPGEVELKALSVEGVELSRVELVWEPTWTPDMMSESAQLMLGFF
jgi:FeS assembly SUF system protein